MLLVHQVSHQYASGFLARRAPALQEVSFEIQSGETVGLLGPNGAGKTTLIQLICGLRPPQQGSISLDGQSITEAESRRKLGFLPERPYYYEFLTGRAFLKFCAQLSIGAGVVIDPAQIDHALSRVSLTFAADRKLQTYSKGMLQRIGIAQAILHRPDFLVLDEPMSGLDPLGRKEIRELIRGLSREGKTILLSSHVLSDVEQLCDHVLVLNQGRVVAKGPLNSVIDSIGSPEARTFEAVLHFSEEPPQQWPPGVELDRLLPGNRVRLKLSNRETASLALQDLLTSGARLESWESTGAGLESFLIPPEDRT